MSSALGGAARSRERSAPSARSTLSALSVLPAITALAALALAACGHSPGQGSDRLLLDAPRWWFSRLPVRVTATPSGALVGLKPSLTVSVNLNVAGKWKLEGPKTPIWIPAAYFTAGTNEVGVKTGSERATSEVLIVSIAWLLTPLAIAAALAWQLAARARARRQSRPAESVDGPSGGTTP